MIQGQKNTYVRTKNNDMEAYVYLAAPEKGTSYTKEEVLSLLAQNGICEGIHESNIAAMVKKGVYQKEVKVADGRPTVHGQDGYYEFYFDLDQKKKQPLIREDGSVDYTSINVIKCVDHDDVLAKYILPVPGKPGVNVRGKLLPPRPAKEKRQLSGTGIMYDEATRTYKATVDGKVELNGARLSVVSMHEINGDVDNVYGNIFFKGDVMIHGNVKPGIKITAAKSITIDGVVEGSDLKAGNDIIVKGGILGAEHSVIETEADLLADFIEYATVSVKGNVLANVFLNSDVTAGGKIEATGNHGRMIGGNIYGMSGVISSEIGNDAFLRTTVAAGVKEQVHQSQYALEHKIEVLTDAIKKIEIETDDIEREIRLGVVNDERIIRKQSLMREKIQKDCTLRETRVLLENMNNRMENGGTASIVVKGCVFAGSVIQIDEDQIVIEKNRDYVEFKKDSENNLILKSIY